MINVMHRSVIAPKAHDIKSPLDIVIKILGSDLILQWSSHCI